MFIRFLDIFISIFLIIVLFPIIIILIIAALVFHKENIFFAQDRAGLNGKKFKLIKFRTMLIDESLSDGERITKFGSFLRNYSLDELPGFLNVIRGDMSLVGPRPLLLEYTKLYNNHQKRRLEVKPGVTGWAQVNGRNLITWEEKFDLDVWYVDNKSLKLNLYILFLTVIKVFTKEGISAQDDQPMPKFRGNIR